ncbi:hypothetical protein [Microbacterium lacticum]
MSTELRDLILERMSPLVPVLNTVMAKAVTVAEHAVTDTAEIEPKYRSTRVHVARTKALSLLTARDDLGAWAVDENQAKKTALRLYSDDVVLRFLHSPTVVPSPGKNHARRAWYTNTSLVENPQLFASPERFLLIWAADFAAGTVAMKVVHPTNAWEFGEKARIDLSVPLDDGEEFTSASFDTRDEEEDLDMPTRTEAAEEEDERDASA